METKICSKCKRELTVDNFNRDKGSKDGLFGYCKGCACECSRAWCEANPEKQKAVQRAWREANPEKRKASKKAWRDANPEKEKATAIIWRKAHPEMASTASKKWNVANAERVKAIHRAWYAANAEKTKDLAKAWHEANPEKVKAADKKWNVANPEKRRYFTQHRNARKRGLLSALTLEQWQDIKEHFDNACCYCGEEKPLHQEHFLALSKGGEYSRDNILPACRNCNSSKGSKDFAVWYPKYRNHNKKREQRILEFLNYKNGIQQLSIL